VIRTAVVRARCLTKIERKPTGRVARQHVRCRGCVVYLTGRYASTTIVCGTLAHVGITCVLRWIDVKYLSGSEDACTQGSFVIEGVSKGEIKRSWAITSEGNGALYMSVGLGGRISCEILFVNSIRDNIDFPRYYPVCEMISDSRIISGSQDHIRFE
jgi:hypothetical protein